MKGQHEEPRRPFPVAQSYRDGTPVGEAPDHRAVVRAINHGGTVKPHGASVALNKQLDEIKARRSECKTPIERIAFDNDPANGPVGLRILAMTESER